MRRHILRFAEHLLTRAESHRGIQLNQPGDSTGDEQIKRESRRGGSAQSSHGAGVPPAVRANFQATAPVTTHVASPRKEKEKDLRSQVKDLMAQAAAADAEEDAKYGSDKRGDELPAELARRESRLKKIREAKRALEALAKEKAAADGKDPKEAGPKDKDQYNFTDPESRIMKGPDGFVQAYNAQAAVEPLLQLIVGQTVTDATNDKEQLLPVLEAVEQQSGQTPGEVLADSGYCSEKNLTALESAEDPSRRVEGYIATERQKHGEYKEICPRGPLPRDATRVDRMRRRLKTKGGRAEYAARKTIVEPV
jgi:hypothetical protein